MANTVKKYTVALCEADNGNYSDYITLEFDGKSLWLKVDDIEGSPLNSILTPEIAREMKSIIDLYLYSLYVKEEGI